MSTESLCDRVGGTEGTKRPGRVRLPFRALCPAIVTVIESILDESRSNSSLALLVSLLCVSTCPSPFFPSFADTRIIRYHQTPFVTFGPPLQMTTIIQNINEVKTPFDLHLLCDK